MEECVRKEEKNEDEENERIITTGDPILAMRST